jgi:hypothetical protein
MVVGCDISETNGLAALKEVDAAAVKWCHCNPAILPNPSNAGRS